MFIETSLGKNAGEIKKEVPGIDLDHDIGKLCFSPAPLQSFRERADESSAAIVTSDVSVADVLIPSFASIKFGEFSESEDARVYDTIKTDVIDSIWEANQPEQSTDEEKDSSRYNFPDFSRTEDLFKERNGNAVVLSDIDNTRKPNDSLIVYRSSRRKSVCNTNNKINQKSETRNESRNCRKIEKKNSALDLNSLKISRRKRTLFPKRDRSSVWGLLGNSLPNSEETGGNDRNIGSNKNLGRIRGDQGKKSADTAKVRKKSGWDWRPPTGRITLKIKIGSQSCGMVHVTEDFNAVEKNGSGLSKIASHEEGDKLRASTENGCSNPGTSPDSEVINTVPDTTIFKKGLSKQDTPRIPVESINQECLKNSVPDFPVVDGSSPIFIRKKSKQGVKKDKFHKFSLESMLNGAKPTSSAKAPAQPESGQEVVDLFCCNDPFTTATGEKYLNACSSNRGLKGPSRCSRMTDSGAPITSYICNSAEVHPSYDYVAPIESSSAQPSDNLILCTNGKKFSKCSKAKGHRKSKSESSDKTCKKERTSKKKSDRKNLFSRHVIDEKDDIDRDNGVGIHLVAGHESLSDLGETGYLSKGVKGSLNNLRYISDEPMVQYAPPRNAWVLCDECQKWRRIPATLADQIEETNCGWTCKDNTDRDFADCSIPQEKSNSEINKELEISDGEEDTRDALLKSNQIHSQAVQKAPSWSLIGSNMFLHRSRKTQTIDEVMVCHCKPPADGRMGCGAKCLNRMLNIECVRGTCPCGELCSNQQFQKHKYAKLMWFRCGKKGFGLQALQDISQGQFLIEYVGEVLDLRAYETRQKEYALQGHRHFYFMTLNGSEVIDACTKGNLGRFINHSCDPNCQTEKWMVNGEVCVGLFAVRDIKKGEEVTFDYNYVRVFGAAAKRCVCGSANCRGYIGGDPTSTEVIVQGDSDEEFAEPVMTCYDRHMKEDWNDIISNSLRGRKPEPISEPPEKRDSMKKQLNVAARSENITSETLVQKVAISSACSDGSFNMSTAKQAADMVPDDDEPDDSLSNDFSCNAVFGLLNAKKNQGEPLSISEPALSNAETEGLQLADVLLQSEEVMNEALSSAQQTPRTEVTTKALASKSQSNAIDTKRKLKYPTLEGKKELVKSDSAVKARLSSSIKKEKLKSNLVSSKVSPDFDKSNAANLKSKCSPDVTINNHVETVEKKLNELLDTEGGISKRRDASRGYLKLLFLTAASGTSGHGEAIQSNRDLSMILDALLKTKSRTVLVDVINKNGLQMLHNIMKRYRKEFNKTPILRKLLKVLEYLATKGILNLEHITGGPPCPGVESFRDSIMTLTEHGDRQVNQIARNFRDRWIPRHLRRRCFMGTDDASIEFPHNSCLGRPSVSSSHDLSSVRFEKSAQPVAESSGALDFPPSVPSNNNNNNIGITEPRVRKRKSRWDTPVNNYASAPPGFSSPRNDESAPPGFSHPCNKKHKDRADDSLPAPNSQERNTRTNPPFGTVLGNSLRKFTASLPLSHGVPHSILRQFGMHEAENATSLKPTPGLPFSPFPPLPTYPRVVSQTVPPKSGGPTSPEPMEKFERSNGGKGACSVYLSVKKSTVADSPEMCNPTGSHNLGRKFFRQQKSSHGKPVPPWVRIRNGQVHGGNMRNGGPTGAGQFRNY